MLPQAFKGEAHTQIDLCPEALAADIDAWNNLIHRTLNNGVCHHLALFFVLRSCRPAFIAAFLR
ncbi:hypothetical protein OAN307_c31380 [Octadecabacter antarcticus 307]|uniref:Transposase n=1 Tax=Octadecabacter antarcticus 307 TaxID=391626 RepID=M9R8Y1_9RHOB|nr:hypothetical protein OAN307_c31380 [Octadecabacter antarcticus 307]